MSAPRSTEHELFEELAAGHALDALEPQDEQAFLHHLSSCARCERALDDHRATAAHLAYGAAPAELPAGLFDRIRADVVAESGEEVFTAPGAALAPVVELASRRRLPGSRVLVAAAAAVALVVGLAGANVALQHDRVEQLASSDRLAQAVRTLESGPGRSVPLRDDAQEVAAVAVLQGDHVSLVVEGLDANEAGTTYVLWEQGRFGGVRALGTFDVRHEGVEVVRDLPLQHGEDGVAAFAITRERGDTAPARPLTVPLASGDVDA
ncbi:MAG: putative transrane anti-sigma factor [Frankiales bacterium]|nr:putative transrane anti-sigma factor [Frankiales bacterium]